MLIALLFNVEVLFGLFESVCIIVLLYYVLNTKLLCDVIALLLTCVCLSFRVKLSIQILVSAYNAFDLLCLCVKECPFHTLCLSMFPVSCL